MCVVTFTVSRSALWGRVISATNRIGCRIIDCATDPYHSFSYVCILPMGESVKKRYRLYAANILPGQMYRAARRPTASRVGLPVEREQNELVK